MGSACVGNGSTAHSPNQNPKMATGKHICCTGGAGYIGSHTVVKLLESGYKVSIMDNLMNASPKVLDRLKEITGQDVPLHKVDMCDAKAVDELFAAEKFDGVIHFAGLKAVGESVAKPLWYYENNLVGTLNILKAMLKHGCPSIVFSSSATVYRPCEEPLDEEKPLGCSNPYGWTKYMIEQIIIDTAKANKDLRVSILRYFNPVGAHPSGRIGESPSSYPNNLMPFVQQVAIGRRRAVFFPPLEQTILAMDFPPGTLVEYHSASMNQWIPARVLQAGRVQGTVDLDCKEGVDVGRVRIPPGAAPPRTVAPTCPKLGSRPPSTSFGPLSLRVGDYCFYKSGTHGWISASVVRYRPEENTYDLDVKQQVGTDKIQTIEAGMLVEYLSTSTNQWISARVLQKGQNAGNYDLDCKAGVHISRLRLPSGSGASVTTAIPETLPQGLSSMPSPKGFPGNATLFSGLPESPNQRGQNGILKPPPAGADRDPKLDQLRSALQAEDPVELRKRMESRSALNYVGEELDHAQHALWVMEARPEALRDLKRACSRNSVDELQAALEAAAVVGVDDEELEAASRRLFALQARFWRYDAGDGRHMDLRKEPRIDGPRIRQRLLPGDVFEVAEELKGQDGIIFLRLADGRGWAFNHKPGTGTMCVKQYAEEEARRSQMGNQPISLTIADLRSQHNKAMRGHKSAMQMATVAEEDSAGPYVILEKTAVTPALALCTEGDIITTLDAGAVVDVLEVSQRAEQKRIRGRISHPRGWISLVDTKSGKRWAEKQSY